MSRAIENDHPWDESEIQYMLDRGREKDVAVNAAEFPPGSEVPDDEDDDDVVTVHPDIFNHVNELEVDDLQTELRKVGLSTKGTEVELKVRLANHLQEELDQTSGGNS